MDTAEVRHLSEDEFLNRMIDALQLDDEPIPVTLDTSPIDDLEFDSLQLVQIIGELGQLTGNVAQLDWREVTGAYVNFRALYELYRRTLKAQSLLPSSIPMPGSSAPRSGTGLPSPSSLAGNLVRLRPLRQGDLPALYEIAIADEVAWRWRFAGAIPSFEVFVQGLNSAVLTQLVMSPHQSDEVLGLHIAYKAELRNRYCYLASVSRPDLIGTGVGFEGSVVFLNHIFSAWDLHKVYIEATQFNYATYASGSGTFFQLEGRLREHHYWHDRRWDQYLLAVYRADFFSTKERETNSSGSEQLACQDQA